jgi:hypothetical protein
VARPLRILLVYAQDQSNATLSYQHGWPRHFQQHPRFSCQPLNLFGLSRHARLAAPFLLPARRFDAVVLLHSVFSNGCALGGAVFQAVRAVRAPKAFFIGNEYKLMPEKMGFCERLGISLLVSQSDSAQVHALYRERLGCAVAGIPNTGFDPELYFPARPRGERPIDVGYRALDSPAYLGHDERSRLAAAFRERGPALGLQVDVSLAPQDRLADAAWADFLNRCKGQLGSEAGGDFFELTDATRRQVNAFVAEHPDAPFAEVHARFFRDYRDPVPLRILSGRNVEAAGTHTVQLLLEGHYSGYLRPFEHYIPLRRDLADLEQAVAHFRDEALCARLTENAHAVVREQLTWERLIDRFDEALRRVL